MVLKYQVIWLTLWSGCMPYTSALDGDQDGAVGDADCDPSDGTVYAGSLYEEKSGPDGVDNNCDGAVDETYDVDEDQDYVPPYGGDCDDTDDRVSSLITEEIPRDGLDNNCDGVGTTWENPVDLGNLASTGAPAVLLSGPASVRLGSSVLSYRAVGAGTLPETTILLGAPNANQDDQGDPAGAVCAVTSSLFDPSQDTGDTASRAPVTEAAAACDRPGEATDQVGWALSLGAFDGDACLDLAQGVTAEGVTTEVELVLDHVGSGCTATSYAITLVENADKDAITLVGDVGGDGYDDLLVGVAGTSDGGVVARLYAGTARPDVDQQVSRGFAVSAEPGDDRVVAPADDVNGDGLQDMLIALPDEGGVGEVYLLLGSDTLDNEGTDGSTPLLEDVAAVRLVGETGWQLGRAVASGQDLDGDGAPDIALGAPGYSNAWGVPSGAALVYLNLPLGATRADAIALAGTSADVRAGTSLAMSADTTTDGDPDLLVGTTSVSDEPGARDRAWLVLRPGAPAAGTETLLQAGEDIVAFSSTTSSTWTVAAVGDVDETQSSGSTRTNGAEVIIADPVNGEVYLYWGQGF